MYFGQIMVHSIDPSDVGMEVYFIDENNVTIATGEIGQNQWLSQKLPAFKAYKVSTEKGYISSKWYVVECGGNYLCEVALDPTTWRGIKGIINAHREAEFFQTGNTISVNEDLVPTDFYILHINYLSSTYGHNIVFARKQQYSQRAWDSVNNVNGWEDSDIKAWLNNDYFYKLDADLQEVISTYGYWASRGGGYTAGDLLYTTNKIWLPSLYQIYATDYVNSVYQTQKNEFIQFDAYKASVECRKKANYWWTCDAEVNGTRVIYFYPGGANYTVTGPTASYGIVPHFMIAEDRNEPEMIPQEEEELEQNNGQ